MLKQALSDALINAFVPGLPLGPGLSLVLPCCFLAPFVIAPHSVTSTSGGMPGGASKEIDQYLSPARPCVCLNYSIGPPDFRLH